MGMERELPPCAKSMSLAPKVIEEFNNVKILYALETIFKVQLNSGAVSDEAKFQLLSLFAISANYEVVDPFAFEKTLFLFSFMGMINSEGLLKMGNELVQWMFNGLIRSSSLFVYSSLTSHSLTPLYFQFLMSFSSYVVKLSESDLLLSACHWLVKYLFSPHFLVKSLVFDIWFAPFSFPTSIILSPSFPTSHSSFLSIPISILHFHLFFIS